MSSYATAFGTQWQTYRRTQLDSYTGGHYSRDRLERCLGFPLDNLRGRTVLEVGCGAGRFTEWLVRCCGHLVSLDMSDAVMANCQNCAHLGHYELYQADINVETSPVFGRTFDIVLSLGVIQHTPSPEQTILSLTRHVRPDGLLVIDHYTWLSRWSPMGQYLTLQYPLRAFLRRVARRWPEVALRLVRGIVAVCDPIRHHTCRYGPLDKIVSRLLPSNCYYATFPDLPREICREWNELDTYDALTDWYKHRRTPAQIRAALEAAGMTDIVCTRGGNGVEARARRP